MPAENPHTHHITPSELAAHDDDPAGAADAAVRSAAASRSTWISVVVNLALTAVQFVVGFMANSQALVADAVHSASDLLSDFIVLVANRFSADHPDSEHNYGHHRFETAASLLLGLLLVGVGAGMLWGAIQQLRTPQAAAPVQMLALWIALATLAAKELLFRYLLAVGKRVRSSMLVANAWHSRSDAASSLVVALGIGGSLAGYPMLDPIAALIVGLMVLRMGVKFAWNALDDLMDRSADAAQVQKIAATLRETPGVLGLHDLRTRKMGDLIVVDVHLEVAADLTIEAGHDIAEDAAERVMARHPVIRVMTHLDPYRRPDRDAHLPGADPTPERTGVRSHGA